MKKLMLVTLMLAVATPAFAMAKKPPVASYQWWLNRPYEVCKEYGHPWVPNYPSFEINGVTVVNPNYDPNKPSYQPEAWKACAQPYYDYVKACFKFTSGRWMKIACTQPKPE